MGLDERLFRAINAWPDWLHSFFVFWSESNKWLPVRVAIGVFILVMLIRPQSRKAAILMLIAWGLANESTDVLKASFKDLRPCVELDGITLHVNRLTSYGTASAHAANMAAVATVMSRYFQPWGYIWTGVALLVGLSRIYVGVHYPSQVLLGWLVGILVALLVVWAGEAAIRRWRGGPPPTPEPDVQAIHS